MQTLAHWIAVNGSVLAVLVTVGVAVLLVCCLECTHCPKREKDELLHATKSRDTVLEAGLVPAR